MKYSTPFRRLALLTACAMLAVTMSLSASAASRSGGEEPAAAISGFSKNGTVTDVITFSPEDFRFDGEEQTALDSVIINSLPACQAGTLMMGDQPLAAGDTVPLSAVEEMRFVPLSAPAVALTSFELTPVFSTGASGEPVTVELYLLTAENHAPVAQDLEFATYKNVAYTGQFSAVDPEGDLLTFQLVDKPARGAVTMPEDGGTEFVYTPYENKTGKDSFTYVAVDAVGNVSEEASVKLKIEKPSTKVTYADMAGNSAYNAAIRLAEEGVYVGASMDGAYYFQPDLPVTRSEFLALAMATVGLEELEGIASTGFFDDEAIETWAKPYVSSALKSGAVQGAIGEDGQVVFRGSSAITAAEAAVLLNRLLAVTDVSAESWTWTQAVSLAPAWASQAVMNLETVGVLQAGTTLNTPLTRAGAAQMLAGALEVLDARDAGSGWFR